MLSQSWRWMLPVLGLLVCLGLGACSSTSNGEQVALSETAADNIAWPDQRLHIPRHRGRGFGR